MKREKWTSEEDTKLVEVLDLLGPSSVRWDIVSSHMKDHGFSRRSKQCRERWLNHLMPQLSKKGWSDYESEKLLDLQMEFTAQWKIISRYFPGRTDNSVKNQFFSLVRKGLRKAMKAIKRNSNTSAVNLIKPKTLSQIFCQTILLPENLIEKDREKASPQWLKGGVVSIKDFVQVFAFKGLKAESLPELEIRQIEFVLNWISSQKLTYQRKHQPSGAHI